MAGKKWKVGKIPTSGKPPGNPDRSDTRLPGLAGYIGQAGKKGMPERRFQYVRPDGKE
ncbi:MAG: hypothetical protein H0W96_16935 [Solirubrobacterales bacterium]|nr:hypothetical protein [Solirubrobacterales bacterium]